MQHIIIELRGGRHLVRFATLFDVSVNISSCTHCEAGGGAAATCEAAPTMCAALLIPSALQPKWWEYLTEGD